MPRIDLVEVVHLAHVASNLDVSGTDAPDASGNAHVLVLVLPRNCQQHCLRQWQSYYHIQLSTIDQHLQQNLQRVNELFPNKTNGQSNPE